MSHTFSTPSSATIWAIASPSKSVFEAVRNTWSWSLVVVSWIVFGMVAMYTTFSWRATSEMASPTAELSPPMRTFTPSLVMSSLAAAAAAAGLSLESRLKEATCSPPMPPAAFTSSTAMSCPNMAGTPYTAPPPVMG